MVLCGLVDPAPPVVVPAVQGAQVVPAAAVHLALAVPAPVDHPVVVEVEVEPAARPGMQYKSFQTNVRTFLQIVQVFCLCKILLL